jgi:hypothetical protein
VDAEKLVHGLSGVGTNASTVTYAELEEFASEGFEERYMNILPISISTISSMRISANVVLIACKAQARIYLNLLVDFHSTRTVTIY